MPFTEGHLTLVVDSKGNLGAEPRTTPIAYQTSGAGGPEGDWNKLQPIWELQNANGKPIGVPSGYLNKVFPLGDPSSNLNGSVEFNVAKLVAPYKTKAMDAIAASGVLNIYVTVRGASEKIKVRLNQIEIVDLAHLADLAE